MVRLLPRITVFVAALGMLPSVALAAPREVEATFTLRMLHSSHGMGIALAPAQQPGDWVEPSLPGVLSIGFDTSNPRTTNWFDAWGNIYGRPEREVSLHWDGVEIANRRSPVELRGAKVDLRLKRVTGGTEITLLISGQAVYDREFLPEVRFRSDPWSFGGQGSVESLVVRSRGVARDERPIRVQVFERVLNDYHNHRQRNTVSFPEEVARSGRVVATLRLDEPTGGFDPWDRLAQVFIIDPNGERFEVLRYITPYDRGFEWKLDVTDLLPLFRGTREFELFCETWSTGWLVSMHLDFYPGRLDRTPYKVVNLWNVTALLGQPERFSLAEHIPKRTITIDGRARSVRARFVVTGHGMNPNSRNAAEFLPLWRILHANDRQFKNVLWKDDNYLNPCRPQGGTWKFDRAGWAPGDVVRPWVVDLTNIARPGQPLTLSYEIEPYVNETPEHGNPARHVIESQLIFYR